MNIKDYIFYVVFVLSATTCIFSIFVAGYAAHYGFWFEVPFVFLAIITSVLSVVLAIHKWAD